RQRDAPGTLEVQPWGRERRDGRAAGGHGARRRADRRVWRGHRRRLRPERAHRDLHRPLLGRGPDGERPRGHVHLPGAVQRQPAAGRAREPRLVILAPGSGVTEDEAATLRSREVGSMRKITLAAVLLGLIASCPGRATAGTTVLGWHRGG